jgi:hypothetical protein
VPPPRKDECEAALRRVAADSRTGSGRRALEVFQQSNRPTITVVEVEEPEGLRRSHHVGAQQEIPRYLTPMTGALYDERT